MKLGCAHEFHEDCIKPWFRSANTCPCCRATVWTDLIFFFTANAHVVRDWMAIIWEWPHSLPPRGPSSISTPIPSSCSSSTSTASCPPGPSPTSAPNWIFLLAIWWSWSFGPHRHWSTPHRSFTSPPIPRPCHPPPLFGRSGRTRASWSISTGLTPNAADKSKKLGQCCIHSSWLSYCEEQNGPALVNAPWWEHSSTQLLHSSAIATPQPAPPI